MQEMIPTRGQLLIIDDEVNILKSLRREFRHDYDVYTADTAGEGYRIMTQHPIHVVISDQRMPGMSGVEFFARIKEEFPDTVRLLLTGYADVQAVIAAINEGSIFRYITKPWDPAELRTIVREAFERYQLVTDNRRLMEELQVSLEKEHQLNLLKSRLMTTVAHQFRTPLAIIRSANELLEDRWERLTEDQRENKLRKIREQVNHLTDILEEISRTMEMEAGYISFHPTPTDLNTYIQQLVEEFQARAAIPHEYAVNLALSNDPVLVDAHLLRYILTNLLTNAVNYSEENSRIGVEAATTDDEIIIRVTDEGIGIPPQDIPYVFDAYFRGTNVVKTEHIRGIGLGLKIVKDCVDLHGGRVEVQSVENQGSAFTIYLPRRPAE
jgi:signal transduction histidine kinase